MTELPKIEAFRNVGQLIGLLSGNEIDNFRPWRNDGYRWISFSDYYYFGTKAPNQTQQNNLAYYLSSEAEAFVQDVKIVLNIYNQQEQVEAVNNFIRMTLKTYSAINVTPPQNLLISLNNGSEFEYEDEFHHASFSIYEAHIPSWRIKIESK